VALDELDALDALPEFMGNPAKAARRDAQVLFDALVHGRRPSPLVKRGARHGDPSQAQVVALAGAPSLTVSRRVKVARVVRETPDAVSLYLEELNGQPLRFRAGQFMSVDVVVDGVRLRRAYSLAAPAAGPGSEAPHITIKRVPDGRVSNLLNQTAHEGMPLDVLGPSGSFVLEPGVATGCAPRAARGWWQRHHAHHEPGGYLAAPGAQRTRHAGVRQPRRGGRHLS
jgi:hypothetical protein